MDTKVWLVSGVYKKNRRVFSFHKEMIALKEAHVRERILSDLGSRHNLKRRDIQISEIKEIKPNEVMSLDLRRRLGVESGQ